MDKICTYILLIAWKQLRNEFLLVMYYMQAYDNNSELIHYKAVTHVFFLLPCFFIHNLPSK